MQPKIVLHLTPDGLLNWRHAERFELYQLIARIAEKAGVELTTVRLSFSKGKAPERLQDGNLNIVHGGRVEGVGFLNASMAYLPGYWHLNTVGTLADSPARFKNFDAKSVEADVAERFHTKLQAEFLKRRKSRYSQKKDFTQLPKDSIAVVLQGRHPYANRQSFMSIEEMLMEVINSNSEHSILVKLHPLEKEYGMSGVERLGVLKQKITITDANIHDLLSAAKVVVSVNSSASFEGFMHGKPSILFGRSDFGSLVSTVDHRGQFKNVFDYTINRSWDYPRMLYWYFHNNTLRVRCRRASLRLAARVAESGLDPGKFGLKDIGQLPE